MTNFNPMNSGNGSLNWDGELLADYPENFILTEGDYNFVVTDFCRGYFGGSAKISPCNKATLTLTVKTTDGKEAKTKVELLLHEKVVWKISSFFRSIGLKEKGQKITMDWSRVPSAVGRAHFKPYTYQTTGGEERTINTVSYFIDYDDKYFADTVEMPDMEVLPF